MSAIRRIQDSDRVSPQVRKVPQLEVGGLRCHGVSDTFKLIKTADSTAANMMSLSIKLAKNGNFFVSTIVRATNTATNIGTARFVCGRMSFWQAKKAKNSVINVSMNGRSPILSRGFPTEQRDKSLTQHLSPHKRH